MPKWGRTMRTTCRLRLCLVFVCSFNAFALAQDDLSKSESPPKFDVSPSLFSGGLLNQDKLLPTELTLEDIQQRLQKTLSPFRAVRENGLGIESAIERLVCIDGTLFDGYASAPKSMLVRSPNELQVAVHNLEDALKDLPRGIDRASIDDPDLRRRAANGYLHRGRLLYGLGALDLAAADFERASQWDADLPVKKWLQQCNTEAAFGGQRGPSEAERAGLIAQSKRDPSTKSLSDLIAFLAQFPNDRQALAAVFALLDNPELQFAELDDHSDDVENRMRQAKWHQTLPLALTRLEIDCATRLIRSGDTTARRRRAGVLLGRVQMYGVALLDTEVLVASPNASAEDWLLHAKSWMFAGGSSMNDTYDNFQRAEAACEKALGLDPESFDAMYTQADIMQSRLQFRVVPNSEVREFTDKLNAKLSILIESAGQDAFKRVTALLLQGRVYEQSGMMKLAQDSFEKAYDIATANKLPQYLIESASRSRVRTSNIGREPLPMLPDPQ